MDTISIILLALAALIVLLMIADVIRFCVNWVREFRTKFRQAERDYSWATVAHAQATFLCDFFDELYDKNEPIIFNRDLRLG